MQNRESISGERQRVAEGKRTVKEDYCCSGTWKEERVPRLSM